ncbi:hypothetical protein FOZ62_008372, partial [Perkinsus olseni]
QYLKPPPSNVKEIKMWMFTMNDVDGCKHYQARATIGDKIHFKTFKPFVPVRLSTAKRLWKESQLFLTGNEGPAPNGVYYGFNAAGTEVTIRFNENAQVEHVQGLEHTGFNELNAASRFKRHGKDGIGNEFVMQDETEERDPDDATDHTLTEQMGQQ